MCVDLVYQKNRLKLWQNLVPDPGYAAPHPTGLYTGGAAAWPLLVPLFMDDAVTPHMWEARLE